MYRYLAPILAIFGATQVLSADFPPNVDGNRQVIKALVNAGSNPAKAHPLEHHFYCFDEKSINLLITKGQSLGYEIKNVGTNTHDGTKYWYGDLVKNTVLDLKIINTENSLMLKLASEFNAEYDGWGTVVVK